MRYRDGQSVEVGDEADLGGGMTGVVVAVVGEGRYSRDFPMEEWSFLEEGVLVRSSEAGLVHYSDGRQNVLYLLRRGSSPLDMGS